MSTGENNPGNNNSDLENLEAQRAIRIFLLQPIDTTQINDLTDLPSLHLTEIALVKKSEKANNPKDLSPLVGTVLDKESFQEAAERHALEKTHLIFANLEQLKSEQVYTFKHRGKSVKRQVVTFVGKLFSRRFDEPYPLDENANIEDFVRVNSKQLNELMDGKKIRGGRVYDALNITKAVNSASEFGPQLKQIETVRDEVSSVLMKEEVNRKMRVLGILVGGKFGNDTSDAIALELEKLQKALKMELNIAENYKKVNEFWAAKINDLVGSSSQLSIALEFANIEDIFDDLEKYKKKIGDTLPTIHMMFPVMFGLNFDMRFLDLLKREQHLEKIYAMSRILFLYNNMQTGEKGAASERLLRKFLNRKDGEIGEKEMVEFFKKLGYLSSEFETTFKSLADDVDMFFQDLQKQSQISPALASLAHINQVEDKPFERILKLAFGSEDTQVRFESQRKLLLVQMAFEAKSYYKQITDKGIVQLDDLEEKLEVNPVFNVETGEKRRVVRLADKDYPVLIERRRKEFGSLLRKVLVRDAWDFGKSSPYNDIYGESYVFDEQAMGEMLEEDRTPPFPMTNGKDKEINTYTAPLVVHNFLQELKTKLGTDEKIEILQFKGLPKEGEGVESNSAGGGAKVRFLKFYIRHTDAKGVARTREVQMFLPKVEKGKTVSGEVDHKAKKDDDERYGLARLFIHGNVYSLIELLFPFHIYGDRMKQFFKVKKHN